MAGPRQPPTPSPTAATTDGQHCTAPTRPVTAVADRRPNGFRRLPRRSPPRRRQNRHLPGYIRPRRRQQLHPRRSPATTTPKPELTRVNTPTSTATVTAHVDAHISTCISERAAGRNRQARIDSNSGDPNCGQARPRPPLHSAPRSSAGPPVPDTLRIGLVDLRRPHRPDPARQRRPPGTRAIQRALAGRPSTGPVQIQPAARRVARQPSRHINHLRQRQSLRLLNLHRRPHRALELVTCLTCESSCSCSWWCLASPCSRPSSRPA